MSTKTQSDLSVKEKKETNAFENDTTAATHGIRSSPVSTVERMRRRKERKEIALLEQSSHRRYHLKILLMYSVVHYSYSSALRTAQHHDVVHLLSNQDIINLKTALQSISLPSHKNHHSNENNNHEYNDGQNKDRNNKDQSDDQNDDQNNGQNDGSGRWTYLLNVLSSTETMFQNERKAYQKQYNNNTSSFHNTSSNTTVKSQHLTEEHRNSLYQNGFCIVDHYLSNNEVSKACDLITNDGQASFKHPFNSSNTRDDRITWLNDNEYDDDDDAQQHQSTASSAQSREGVSSLCALFGPLLNELEVKSSLSSSTSSSVVVEYQLAKYERGAHGYVRHLDYTSSSSSSSSSSDRKKSKNGRYLSVVLYLNENVRLPNLIIIFEDYIQKRFTTILSSHIRILISHYFHIFWFFYIFIIVEDGRWW